MTTMGSALKRALITIFVGANIIVFYYNVRQSGEAPRQTAAETSTTDKMETRSRLGRAGKRADSAPAPTSRPSAVLPTTDSGAVARALDGREPHTPVDAPGTRMTDPPKSGAARESASAGEPINDRTKSERPLPSDAIVHVSSGVTRIAFDPQSVRLSSEGKHLLIELFNRLSVEPRLKAQIVGHTDNRGDQVMNLELSIQRARAVADYLAKLGISRERVVVQGLGGTRPLADDKTAGGRATNNRVEIVELANPLS